MVLGLFPCKQSSASSRAFAKDSVPVSLLWLLILVLCLLTTTCCQEKRRSESKIVTSLSDGALLILSNSQGRCPQERLGILVWSPGNDIANLYGCGPSYGGRLQVAEGRIFVDAGSTSVCRQFIAEIFPYPREFTRVLCPSSSFIDYVVLDGGQIATLDGLGRCVMLYKEGDDVEQKGTSLACLPNDQVGDSLFRMIDGRLLVGSHDNVQRGTQSVFEIDVVAHVAHLQRIVRSAYDMSAFVEDSAGNFFAAGRNGSCCCGIVLDRPGANPRISVRCLPQVSAIRGMVVKGDALFIADDQFDGCKASNERRGNLWEYSVSQHRLRSNCSTGIVEPLDVTTFADTARRR